MSPTCESCGVAVLDIDVKCPSCGAPLTSTGAFRMVGQVMLGQYEIVDVLGAGGMSVVYKGRHKLTDQEVALKILPPELAALSQLKSRFVEEAKALAQLDHPNIVHLYNFGEENGCFVLAMQYVRGQTFERMILDAGVLDWRLASRITLDVLRALEYAHGRGIVHRDMKPSNVLVREHDGSATVMDFGIAKITNSTRLTATGQTMGTVRYMSPEQVRGLSVDARTDIYSLGATLYEAVCGDTPFDGDTHFEIMTRHLHEPPRAPHELGIHVPPVFEGILLRALAKSPEARFSSAGEFRLKLEAALRDHESSADDSRQPALDTGAREARLARSAAVTAPLPAGLAAAADRAPTSAMRTSDGQLEARVAVELTDPGLRPDALADGNEREPGRGRAWLAAAGALVVMAAAAVVYVQQRAGSAQPSTVVPTAVAPVDAAPTWPVAFLPPEVTFAVDQIYPDEVLRVLAPDGWDAGRVRDARQAGHAVFARMLGVGELAAQPLTVAIVPQRVFCDARVHERGRISEACREAEVIYRPGERTLLVLDNPGHLDVNVAYGNAIAVCLHSQIPGCDDAAQGIDRQFEGKRESEGAQGEGAPGAGAPGEGKGESESKRESKRKRRGR